MIAAARSAENDVWQLIKCMMPVRKLRCTIHKHVVIDQKNPFVLFAIGLESDFSRFITKNTFENFEILQKQLYVKAHADASLTATGTPAKPAGKL